VPDDCVWKKKRRERQRKEREKGRKEGKKEGKKKEGKERKRERERERERGMLTFTLRKLILEPGAWHPASLGCQLRTEMVDGDKDAKVAASAVGTALTGRT
jgi:hypothetical protein